MAAATTTEYRVRKIDPNNPKAEIYWGGPFYSQQKAEDSAEMDRRFEKENAEYVVESRIKTVTTTDWEPTA